jgi:serine/threonine protein kinase
VGLVVSLATLVDPGTDERLGGDDTVLQVRLLGTYEDANTLNLVMEACRGGSLHTLLNTKPSPGTVLEPIPEDTILDWCAPKDRSQWPIPLRSFW